MGPLPAYQMLFMEIRRLYVRVSSNGKQILGFSRGCKAACKAINQPSLVPHDMRRSGARTFRKVGLSKSEGMLSGCKTNAVYDAMTSSASKTLGIQLAKV